MEDIKASDYFCTCLLHLQAGAHLCSLSHYALVAVARRRRNAFRQPLHLQRIKKIAPDTYVRSLVEMPLKPALITRRPTATK